VVFFFFLVSSTPTVGIHTYLHVNLLMLHFFVVILSLQLMSVAVSAPDFGTRSTTGQMMSQLEHLLGDAEQLANSGPYIDEFLRTFNAKPTLCEGVEFSNRSIAELLLKNGATSLKPEQFLPMLALFSRNQG
jgi:hypothetical protein